MYNLGYSLYNGEGIKKDKKAAVHLYWQSLKKGFLTSQAKKAVDEYYNKNSEFRLKNPNYKKWTQDYNDFEKQSITLL